MNTAQSLLATFAVLLSVACSDDAGRKPSCAPASAPDAAGSAPDAAGDVTGPPPTAPTITLPDSVAGIEFPQTLLARAAAQMAFEASPEVLYNHLMRSYVFGSLYLRDTGKSYDAELAFIGSVLHDLGLLEAFWSPAERFEVDGADAAKSFLDTWHVPAERAEIVWDAIALHTQTSIAARKRPEITLVSLGAVMDASGLNLSALSPDDVATVLEAFPRIGFKQDAVETMTRLCEQKPLGQLLHPFADVGRRHLPDFSLPTIEDLMLAAPFEE